MTEPPSPLRIHHPARDVAPEKQRRLAPYTVKGVLTHLCRPDFLGRAPQEWTFKLACAFWELDTAQCGAVLVNRRLDAFTKKLRRCAQAVKDTMCVLPDGGGADSSTVAMLQELHVQLLERYDSHLQLLRKRKAP